MLLVIGLAILLVLLPFLGKFFLKLGGEGPKEVCKSSVLANALLRVDRTQFSENIECKEEFATLATRRESKVYAELAGRMADCWEQFLEGRRELFGDDGTYCHICSHIAFKNKTLKLAGFDEYVFGTNVPQKDATYATYLAPYLSGKSEDITNYVKTSPAARQAWSGQVIDTSKEYAVIFFYSKGRDPQTVVRTLTKLTAYGIAFASFNSGLVILDLVFGGIDALFDLASTTLWFSSVSLIEFTPQNLAAFGCQELVRQRQE
jgi:hypothetical protein